MIKRIIAFPLLVGLFCLSFLWQEQVTGMQTPSLKLLLPAVVQKASLGFLKQIGAEAQYIAISVFLGGTMTQKNVNPANYAENLAYNFETITDIYSNFPDFYYLCQSSLPYISPEYAIRTAKILLKGEKFNPKEILLPSWAATDYFYYAGNNKKAAAIYLRLARGDVAPKWFGHLAAVLTAKDGNLHAGIATLQMMLKTATEKWEKERYKRDIKIFQDALQVANAVRIYEKDKGHKPKKLSNLIPEYLQALPNTGDLFILTWNGQIVSLQRPDKKRKRAKPLIFKNI